MQPTIQTTASAPRRRTIVVKPAVETAVPTAEQLPLPASVAKPATKAKKMPAAAVEATAAAFLAGFKALPGAVQWRVVQLIEDYEDELDDAQLAADMAANPDDYDPKNAIPWEQVKAEMDAQTQHESSASQKQAA